MRLLATMRWDIVIQVRNGFYYATLILALMVIALLSQLDHERIRLLLPIFLFFNLMTNTFYFLAGLVLLEKREGTLEAQIVTPLRPIEYLTSKLATLIGLSMLENIAVVGFVYGLSLNLGWLISGLILAGMLYSLLGFLVVVRYDSINSYLLPSSLYMLLISIPAFVYFGLGESWLMYLHPLQGPLLLFQATFQPLEYWQLGYAFLYPLLWIAFLYHRCLNQFQRFIISKEGVSV